MKTPDYSDAFAIFFLHNFIVECILKAKKIVRTITLVVAEHTQIIRRSA